MQAIIISSEQFEKLLNKIEALDLLVKEVQKQNISRLYLNNNQLSVLLGVSKKTLLAWRNRGLIKFSQIGNKIFYKLEDLESFMQNHSVPTIEVKLLSNKK